MDEELESLLREHYRRSAQTINPDPGLVGRIRSTARPRRRLRLPGRLALAAAVALVAMAGSLTWLLHTIGTTTATTTGGGGRVAPAAVQPPPLTVTVSAPAAPRSGPRQDVTGSVNRHTPLPLVVETETGGRWIGRARVTALNGSYRTRLEIPVGTSALRVCTTTAPTVCSRPVPLAPERSPQAPPGSPIPTPGSTSPNPIPDRAQPTRG